MKIVWSKNAKQDFDNIIDYLENHWNEKAAMKFVIKTFDFIGILKSFPRIGSLQIKNKEIRGFVLVKQITIFYTFNENQLVLLKFFDNRQNPSKKKTF